MPPALPGGIRLFVGQSRSPTLRSRFTQRS